MPRQLHLSAPATNKDEFLGGGVRLLRFSFFVHIKMILSVTSLHSFLRSLLIILHCLALGATGPGGELEAASAVSQIVASRF